MKRLAAALLLATVAAIAAVAAAGTGASRPAAHQKTVTLKVWLPFTARELGILKNTIAEYDRKHAKVKIDVTGGVDTTKIVAAIRSGNGPDVAMDFESANVGTYCSSGAWSDLGKYLKRDHVDVDIFTKASQYYTQYKGKRCALPLLADDAGLYYNKTMFRAAGIKSPPKTVSELAADAKKLTKKNTDGSIKIAGFDPVIGFYTNSVDRIGGMFGGKWVDSKGHSTLGKDKAWSRMLRWQKNLVDWYGYKKLQRFQAGLGDEFSGSNAFEVGKLAMNVDGEWRVAFIADEHPELSYGTAPLPVDDNHPELYGSSAVNGSIVGIAKTSKNKDDAWKLVKYLTTNDHPLAQLSNGLRNVPSTRSSLKSPELKPDARFQVFLKIYAHKKSSTVPITAAGVAYQNLFTAFISKWQAGNAGDLKSGLKKVDKQIDAQLKQASRGGTP